MIQTDELVAKYAAEDGCTPEEWRDRAVRQVAVSRHQLESEARNQDDIKDRLTIILQRKVSEGRMAASALELMEGASNEA